MELQELQTTQRQHRGLLITAGLLLGIGLGGLLDGILLHQILQWHHMLTSIRPMVSGADVEVNTLWDGFFNGGMLLSTVLGIVFLYYAGKEPGVHSGNTFLGSLLLGVGLFNFVEGLINHYILGLHHVKPGPHTALWDLGFLALAAMLMVVGGTLVQFDRQSFGKPSEKPTA